MKGDITAVVLYPGERDAYGNIVTTGVIKLAFAQWTPPPHKEGEARVLKSYLNEYGAWVMEVSFLCPSCKRTDGWRGLLFWRWWHRLRCPTFKMWKQAKRNQVGISVGGYVGSVSSMILDDLDTPPPDARRAAAVKAAWYDGPVHEECGFGYPVPTRGTLHLKGCKLADASKAQALLAAVDPSIPSPTIPVIPLDGADPLYMEANWIDTDGAVHVLPITIVKE